MLMQYSSACVPGEQECPCTARMNAPDQLDNRQVHKRLRAEQVFCLWQMEEGSSWVKKKKKRKQVFFREGVQLRAFVRPVERGN